MMPKHSLRKVLIFALLSVAIAITSCGAYNLIASPTPTITPTPTVTLTITPSLTPTHRPSPTVTPSPIISPQIKDMLSYFPLVVGNQRVYAVSITYATGLNDKNEFIYQEWHGFVHQNVVKQYATKMGVTFDLYYPDYPSINTDNVSTGELTRSLEFRDDGVYENDEIQFQFPLSVGQEWLAFDSDFPEYKWVVGDQDKVTTPAGQFDECYSISLLTRPDTTNIWFCKGIGVVEESAFHHPPEWMFKWQLYSFTKGSK